MDRHGWALVWAWSVRLGAAALVGLAIEVVYIGTTIGTTHRLPGPELQVLMVLVLGCAVVMFVADQRRKQLDLGEHPPPALVAAQRWEGWRSVFIGLAVLSAVGAVVFGAVVTRFAGYVVWGAIGGAAVNVAIFLGLAWAAHRRVVAAKAAAAASA